MTGLATRRSARTTGSVDPARWRFERALARIEPTIEPIMADHATSYWCRPVRRREVPSDAGVGDRRVVWTIDDELVLDVRVAEDGKTTIVVHDFSLYTPLRKALRTRHVRVRMATYRDSLA